MTNINDEQAMNLYYQIDYTVTEVPDDAAYFHAQYRRTKVNETSDYTIISGSWNISNPTLCMCCMLGKLLNPGDRNLR